MTVLRRKLSIQLNEQENHEYEVGTGLKLACYFGTSDKYFVNLQTDVDIREEKQKHWKELEDIKPIHA